jgi:hypothetical protein
MKARVVSDPVKSHRKAVIRHSLAMRVLRPKLPSRVASIKPRSTKSLKARLAVFIAMLHSFAASRTESASLPLFAPL